VRHGERLSLQRRVLRLGKPPRRWKRPPWARALAAAPEPRERVLSARPLNGGGGRPGVRLEFADPSGGPPLSVEALALAFYATADGGAWRGVHTEGGVWTTLFGLLLWDVIFAPVPDVFRTPFQDAPLDLGSDAFQPARAAALDARLAAVADGGGGALIASAWGAHRGAWCRGVRWEAWALDDLLDIAACLGGVGLAVVCRLLAEDYSGWTGGAPDLLLWRPSSGPAPPAARLVEVKSANDKLSDAQRAWIGALLAAGVDVEVLKVRP